MVQVQDVSSQVGDRQGQADERGVEGRHQEGGEDEGQVEEGRLGPIAVPVSFQRRNEALLDAPVEDGPHGLVVFRPVGPDLQLWLSHPHQSC